MANLGANKSLSNLAATAINAALMPDIHDTLDLGSDSVRWKDGHFQGTLTTVDLVVESGESIKLAGATFENKGHYTSVDTNWIVQHDDADTAFIGVYAESTGVMTHANLVLDAQGSAINILKNSPIHPWSPYAGGIVNEDGSWGTFVEHDQDISWNHFDVLTKDAYGNVTYMSGIQENMRLTDHTLLLETVDLEIEDTDVTKVKFSATEDSYFDTDLNVGIGTQTPAARLEIASDDTAPMFRLQNTTNSNWTLDVHVDNSGDCRIDIPYGGIGINKDADYEIDFDVKGIVQAETLLSHYLHIDRRQNGLHVGNNTDNDIDLIQWDTFSGGGIFKWDNSAGAYRFDYPIRLNQEHVDYGGVLWLDESVTGPSAAEGGAGHQLWAGDDHKLYWTDHLGGVLPLGVWDRTGTKLTTSNSGDDVEIDGDLLFVAGGGANYGVRTSGSNLWIGNNDSLIYTLSNQTWTTAEGRFTVGYDGVAGDLIVNAEDGGTAGAKLRIYVGADYIDSIDRYEFKTVEDDLLIGPNTDPDAFKFTSDGSAVTAAFNVDLTVTGDVTATEFIDSTNNISISMLAQNNQATGWCDGGDISINSGDNTLIDITAGTIMVADYTDQVNPVIQTISWSGQTGLDPGLVGRSKWIGVQDDGFGAAEFVYDGSFDAIERRTIAILGRIWDSGGTGPSITNVGDYERPTWGLLTAFQDFVLEHGSWNISGNVYAPNGTNLLLNKTAGKSFRYHAEDTVGQENVHTDAAQVPRSAYAYHLQGSSTVSVESAIDPDYYDNAGVKTAVPNKKWTVQELWFFPVSGTCHVVYGQTVYQTKADAIGGIADETKARNAEILDGAVHRAHLAVVEGCTDLSDPDEAVIRVTGNGAGGGAGSTYWNRTAGILTPAVTGDNVSLSTGGTLSIADMAQGSIPFVDASGLVAQDNANLFWDNTNKRVGIGTALPSYPLDVEGDGGRFNRGSQNSILNYLAWDTTDIRFGGQKTENRIGTFINEDFRLVTNSTNRVTIDKDGAIGIGTETPARAFHMQANNATLRVDRDAKSPGIQIHHFPSGDFSTPLKGFVLGVKAVGVDDGIFFISDFHQNVAGSSDQRLTIDTDGFVGIGIPSPSGILHVGGSGNQTIKVEATDDAPATVNLISNGTQKGIMGYNESDYVVIAHSETGATKDNAGLRIQEGNVGIGVTPSYDLHVEKDVEGYVTSRLYNTNALGIAEHTVGASSGGHILLVANSSGSSHYDIPDGSAGLAATWGGRLTISVGDGGSASKMMQFNAVTDVATLSADLDVGSIINAGSLKLQPDVQGDVELFSDTNVDNAENGKMLYVRRQAAEGNNYMRFYITASRDGMIHTNADLTMQGQTEFTINSVTQDIHLKVGDDAGSKKVYFKNSSGNNIAYVDSLGNAQFDGKMGIGIETPECPLHVAGQDESAILQLERVDDIIGMGYSVGAIIFKAGEVTPDKIAELRVTATENWTATSAPTRMEFFTTPAGTHQAARVMTLQESGDVGIGTVVPTEKLDVEGSIRAKDAVVYSDGSTQETSGDTLGFGWHVTTAIYKQTKDMDTETDGPCGAFFKPDGLRLYVVDNQLDKVFEYDLSVAWDVLTATYNSNSFTTTGSSSPQGICFRSDGKKMYLADPGDDEINEYDLSTAWDITSASWLQLYDCSVKETTPTGVHFRPDGRKMYIIGNSSDALHEYTLSTPWDITTATWDQDFGIDIDSPEGFCFKPDGTRLYVMDASAEDDVHEYELTTPWDISTAVLKRLFNVAGEDGVPTDVLFRPDGTKMYIVGNNNNSIYEYDLGITVHGHAHLDRVGIGTDEGLTALEVWDEDDNQAFFADTTAQAAGVGGGLMFGGKYTDAGDMAVGGRIGVKKANNTSGNYDFDMVFATQSVADTLWEWMRIKADGKVGIGTDSPSRQLGVRSSDDETMNLGGTATYGLGVGPALRFSGRGNSGPSQFEAAKIKAEKYDGTSGNIGFDLVLYAHENGVGSLVEMLRLSAEDGTVNVPTALTAGSLTASTVNGIIFDSPSIDNISVGQDFTGSLTGNGNINLGTSNLPNITSGDMNVVIGVDSGDGITDDTWNVVIGAWAGRNSMEDNNVLIGYQAELPSGTTANGLNIANTIFGASNERVRIGGGSGLALLPSAALEIKSTTGALIVPKMTTTQRNAMTAVNGMIIYDTTQNAFRKRQNGSWMSF